MAVFKCKMCGGSLEINENATVGVCEYCGTTQTLPRLNDERKANLYDRANHFRRSNEFDKAMAMYEQILEEDNTDAEAYWSIVLCRYGIEYVEDPITRRRVPTVNRAQYTSVLADEDYKSALRYADSVQYGIYEEEARVIDNIQKGILEISQKEEPFDVFICYKETDNSGKRTQDSVLANDLYHQLTLEGFKVFFSRITLEDKLGTAYEPYIFAALNSAKVMIVIGTKAEYFNAVWVKNEWKRYLALIKQGEKKMLIPAYRDMDPYDLPEEFSHLQAQDMSKLGFMQDLIRGIKKILEADAPKTEVKEIVYSQANIAVEPLVKRIFLFLEDGDFDSADDYCEKVLDQDPENGQAYLGKLMAELKICKLDDFSSVAEPFDKNKKYIKAIKFLDDNTANYLSECNTFIVQRNHQNHLEDLYQSNLKKMNSREADIVREAKVGFQSLEDYKDSRELVHKCDELIQEVQNNKVYTDAFMYMNHGDEKSLQKAIQLFETVSGWKEAENKLIECNRLLEELRIKKEKERLEAERKAEQARVKKELKKKKIKKALIISLASATLVTVALLVYFVIIPAARYNKAIKCLDVQEYQTAYDIFVDLGDYKDSVDQSVVAYKGIKELEAKALIESGDYESAYAILEEIDRYVVAKEDMYSRANAYLQDGKLKEAIELLEAIEWYEDAEIVLQSTRATYAIELMESDDFEGAEIVLNDLFESEISAPTLNNNAAEAKKQLLSYAKDCVSQSKYEQAFTILNYMRGEKEALDLLAEFENVYYQELIANAEVGDSVYWGKYEQDGIKENGTEPIEWIVLDKDGDKVLVVSRYILDYCCYQKDIEYNKYLSWEVSDVRKWLQNSFYDNSFTSAEKKCIVNTLFEKTYDCPTTVISGFVGGDKEYIKTLEQSSKDKVFLFDYQEIKKYQLNVLAETSKVVEDIYGSNESAYLMRVYFSGTRTEYNYDTSKSCWNYSEEAHLDTKGNRLVTRNVKVGVRPAMWIDISE